MIAPQFPFDADHDAAMLLAAGYEHEHVAEEWEDIGDAENGPKLSGHPELDVYTARISEHALHEVVVCGGYVVQCGMIPDWSDDH